MAAPIRQPRTPSPAPQLGEDTYNSAFTGGFNNQASKPPHLGRQSLGPPPTVRSNSGGPLSPGSGLYQHSQSNHQHLQQQQQQHRVSLAGGDRLGDPRASSPRLPSSGYGNGLSAGSRLGAGLRNVSAGSAFGGSQYIGGSGLGVGGGLRPQSEYIGGLASGMFGREHQMPECKLQGFSVASLCVHNLMILHFFCLANTMDSWFQDLQQYESTLDALATASLDQAFTDELNAIEQCKFPIHFLANSLRNLYNRSFLLP
jgi:hypothetical protein